VGCKHARGGQSWPAAIAALALFADTSWGASPQATIVAGEIVRDSATVGDIERTATATLAIGRPYRLVVIKSRYRLDVLEGDHLLKAFPVALGLSPKGPKERSGDMKTPEGQYTLLPHLSSPGFGECFYICYPSPEDAERGLQRGLIGEAERGAIVSACREHARPPSSTHLGGLVLLHGTKDRSELDLTRHNWTWGCVAMENRDLLQLLSLYGRNDRPSLEIDP
jgi:murein L,D-transpeptidase YafK